MYPTRKDRSNERLPWSSIRRSVQRILLKVIGIILPLLISISVSHAVEEAAPWPSLEKALKASGANLPKVQLHDGRLMTGRFIKLRAETIILRRPSGGLRSIPMTDIEHLEIGGEDGERLFGRSRLLADGTMRWELINSSSQGEPQPFVPATDKVAQSEAGGPLIKLSPTSVKNDLPRAEAMAVRVNDPKVIGEDGLIRKITAQRDRLLAMTSPAQGDGIHNLPSPVRLSVTAAEVSEAEKTLVFQLELSEPTEQTIAIIYTLLSGSATAAADYEHRQGVVIFKPGQQRITLPIVIIDDGDIEETETLKLFMTGDPNMVTIDHRTAEASIRDNDAL